MKHLLQHQIVVVGFFIPVFYTPGMLQFLLQPPELGIEEGDDIHAPPYLGHSLKVFGRSSERAPDHPERKRFSSGRLLNPRIAMIQEQDERSISTPPRPAGDHAGALG